MKRDEAKHGAVSAALAELPWAGTIGLGSGSTAALFIDEVGALVRAGRALVGVATSEASRARATALGIPLLPDEGPWDIDVTVDGADEVDAALHLIKGGGGAHTREKMVSFASRVNVIVVDATKLSQRVGEKRAVPIEVLRFGHLATASHVLPFGRATRREDARGPVLTDSGNFVYDVATGPIEDPARLARALRAIPGVVETGLFVGRADVVLVGSASGVRRLTRPSAGG